MHRPIHNMELQCHHLTGCNQYTVDMAMELPQSYLCRFWALVVGDMADLEAMVVFVDSLDTQTAHAYNLAILSPNFYTTTPVH